VQQDPATRVSAPAVGLIVAAGLSLAFNLLYLLVIGLIGVAAVTDPQTADALPAAGAMIGVGVIALALNVLTLYAAWQMRQLRGWGLSMAGAILAMLPCTPCCIIGLPIGIWAILVLIDNDVKAAFDRGGPSGGYGGGAGGYGGGDGGYDPPG
jgi:hypothetical protein